MTRKDALAFLVALLYGWVGVWCSFAIVAILTHTAKLFAYSGGMALGNLAVAQWLGRYVKKSPSPPDL